MTLQTSQQIEQLIVVNNEVPRWLQKVVEHIGKLNYLEHFKPQKASKLVKRSHWGTQVKAGK